MVFLLITLALVFGAFIGGSILIGTAAEKAKDRNYVPAALAVIVLAVIGYFLLKANFFYMLAYLAGLVIAFMQTVDPFAMTQETADKYGEYAKAKAEAVEAKKEEEYQEKRRREAEEKAYKQALEHEKGSQEKNKK